MKVIKGDLIKAALRGEYDVIIHGCNCFCTMGKGIAFDVKRYLPEAYQVDKLTIKGDRSKLGTYSAAQIMRKNVSFVVVNAYTQYDFWTPGRRVDYDALKSIFEQIKENFAGQKIAYSKIGCGLGGGDWSVVSKIIDQCLEGENHTLVSLY